jgi:hypothetical protein
VTGVDEYLQDFEHPFLAELLLVRRIVLAEPAIEERVKWKSPSFFSGADDLGAFELRPKAFLRLILVFPHGLTPHQPDWFLGNWKDRRELRFTDLADVERKQPDLERVVSEWVGLLPG